MSDMMSEGPKHSELVSDAKNKSAAYVRDWKKRAHVATQSTLQTKSEAFTAWVLTQGWALRDMRVWTSLCEKAKYSQAGAVPGDELKLLCETLDFADHLDVHPIGLICYARAEMRLMDWTLEAVKAVRETLLQEDEADEKDSNGNSAGSDDETEVTDEVLVCPGAPQKKARTAHEDERPLDIKSYLNGEPTQLEKDFDADVDDKLELTYEQ